METPSPAASAQLPSAECAFQCAGSAVGGLPLAEIDIPDSLRGDLALFLRLERKVLDEYDPEIRSLFDRLLQSVIAANEGDPGSAASDEPVDEQGIPLPSTEGNKAFREAVDLLDMLPIERAQVVVRAFTSFFHLANLSEENYRVKTLRERGREPLGQMETDPTNELTVAYRQLVDEMGVGRATELLNRLEFHPVFTAHPTEARRKAVEGKIRRIALLLANVLIWAVLI